jgi:hypothetical protein
MPDEQEVSESREALRQLERAAVDASSMIYMLKAGFLGYAAAEVQLLTVGPVAAEVGWPELPVTIADLRRGGDVPWTQDTVEIADAFVGPGKHRNDELLLDLALARSVPLISEDGRLLERAREAGLDYYNALMILALLLIRGRITDSQYAEYAGLLARIGWYSTEVTAFARAIAEV